jgi:putative transposase
VASTFLSLHYHIVFSTKERIPFIEKRWRPQLFAYIGGTIQGLGGYSEGVGGVSDHIHALVGLKATHCLADFMRELKKGTTAWIHETVKIREFAWQVGYAAFTVSPNSRNGVKGYISNQEAHHTTKTFRDELVELLKAAGVTYKSEYLE